MLVTTMFRMTMVQEGTLTLREKMKAELGRRGLELNPERVPKAF